jgi:hypothetical protein
MRWVRQTAKHLPEICFPINHFAGPKGQSSLLARSKSIHRYLTGTAQIKASLSAKRNACLKLVSIGVGSGESYLNHKNYLILHDAGRSYYSHSRYSPFDTGGTP